MRKIYRTITLSIFASFIFGFPLRADFTFSDWKYYKEISGARGGVVKLQLDQESFAGMQKDLSDLRVVSQVGGEAPYKLVVEESRTDRTYYDFRIFNNAYSEGLYQQFMVDLGAWYKKTPHNFIEILSPEENYKKRIEVAGGDDAESWQILTDDGYIFDYTDRKGNFHGRDNTVEYPESTFRYLRIKIFSDTPFTVNGAGVYAAITKEALETTFDASLSQKDDITTGYTYITVDLGQGGLPTRELILKTNDTNFDRPLSITGYEKDPASASQKRVAGLGNGYIFRYNTSILQKEDLAIHYSETNLRYLFIEIFNGDDKPIHFTGAKIKGVLRSIIFEAQDGKSYRLYYGNAKARRPAYDIERRFPSLDLSRASPAGLGPQVKNRSFHEALPPFSERFPSLLPLTLVFASLATLALVYRFMKKV